MSAAPRKFGWLPEPEGAFDDLTGGRNRDASEDLLAGAAPAPKEALRLVPHLPPFKEQGDSSTCVGHGILNVGESTLRATTGTKIEPGSIPQVYTTANQLIEPPGSPLQDIGTYGRVVMHVCKEWGVAPDRIWPFRDPRTGKIDHKRLVTRVPPDVLMAASSWKLDEQLTIYATGEDRLRTVDAAIANLSGIPTAGVVDQAFLDYQGRGVLGAPDPRKFRGRHMVAIIGYRTNAAGRREYLIRNSWRAWGLVLMNQPSLAWVNEGWVLAQEEMFRLRVSKGRKTA